MLLMYLWTVYCQEVNNICCALSKIVSCFEEETSSLEVVHAVAFLSLWGTNLESAYEFSLHIKVFPSLSFGLPPYNMHLIL